MVSNGFYTCLKFSLGGFFKSQEVEFYLVGFMSGMLLATATQKHFYEPGSPEGGLSADMSHPSHMICSAVILRCDRNLNFLFTRVLRMLLKKKLESPRKHASTHQIQG